MECHETYCLDHSTNTIASSIASLLIHVEPSGASSIVNSSPNDLTNSSNTFTKFPELAPELRIKIWRCIILPRRILIENSNKIPKEDVRSVVGLLLVNKEAYDEVSLKYTRCLDHNSKGLLINSDIDTLQIPNGITPLRNIFPAMNFSTLKYLDIAPLQILNSCYRHQQDYTFLASIPTLRLITLCSVGYRQKHLDQVARNRWQSYSEFYSVPRDRALRMLYKRGIFGACRQLAWHLRLSKRLNAQYDGKVVVIFGPEDMGHELQNTSYSPKYFRLEEPTEEIWERIKESMNSNKQWCGKKEASSIGWFVKKLKTGATLD